MPEPRRVLALGVAFAGLAAMASIAPTVAAVFAVTVATGTLLRRGDALEAIERAVTSDSPISEGARPLVASVPLVGPVVTGTTPVSPGTGAPASPTAGAGRNVGGVVAILPGQPQWTSYGYGGDREGQGGRHLAVDWFAPAGTPVRAPVSGRVVRVSPDPDPGRTASGQVYGGVVSIRDAQGRLIVMRHIVPSVAQGSTVSAGQVVGTVKDWAGSDHIHLETYRPGSSDREYGSRFVFNPRELFGQLFT